MKSETDRIKILLVDDNEDFLDSAERFLATDPLCCVVGKALSGETGVELAKELRPDVVLMDLMMPGMNGFDAARNIRMGQNPPLIIMLTLYDVDVYRSLARASGADAFITKDNMGSQVVPLIKNLLQREIAR